MPHSTLNNRKARRKQTNSWIEDRRSKRPGTGNFIARMFGAKADFGSPEPSRSPPSEKEEPLTGGQADARRTVAVKRLGKLPEAGVAIVNLDRGR